MMELWVCLFSAFEDSTKRHSPIPTLASFKAKWHHSLPGWTSGIPTSGVVLITVCQEVRSPAQVGPSASQDKSGTDTLPDEVPSLVTQASVAPSLAQTGK